MRCILFLLQKESDGISNGSIIIVCFSFWQKISSQSSRWSKPVWLELIRGHHGREYTFNNIDEYAQKGALLTYISAMGHVDHGICFEGNSLVVNYAAAHRETTVALLLFWYSKFFLALIKSASPWQSQLQMRSKETQTTTVTLVSTLSKAH